MGSTPVGRVFLSNAEVRGARETPVPSTFGLGITATEWER